jgi:hypothetical protein
MLGLDFKSLTRAREDAIELSYLRSMHGENMLSVLRDRAADHALSERSRKHWKRILSKAVNGR